MNFAKNLLKMGEQTNGPKELPGVRRCFKKSTDDVDDRDVVAVVVTIFNSGSYDEMFREHEPETSHGRIVVYAATYSSLPSICKGLKSGGIKKNDKGKPETDLDELIQNIGQVDADSVVFNWECSGDCSGDRFPNKQDVMEVAKLAIDRGNMCMFSDFSLKALIKEWDSTILGPNPLKQIGVFDTSCKLVFDAERLTACPSTQLQKVGELCSKGECGVHAMSSTIRYTVEPEHTTTAYTTHVLTIMSECEGSPVKKGALQIGTCSGNAGHVLLEYPSGGTLLCSATHWAELAKLDVNYESLVSAAKAQYGEENENYQEMMSELQSATPENMGSIRSKHARKMVYKSAPVQYSNCSKKSWS